MTSAKKRVLLTGASGLFGSNALLLGHDRFELTGVYHRNRPSLPGLPEGSARLESVDLTDARAAAELLARAKPDAILHAAANANLDDCENAREAALLANVEVPRALARHCQEEGIHFTHFSTDAFFGGAFFESGPRPFREDDEPTPVNFYGETKLRAERAIREACPDHALIIRTNFYGWNSRDNKRSLAEWILSQLGAGKPTPLFTDVVCNPLFANTLAETLFDLIDRRHTGTLHERGREQARVRHAALPRVRAR
jgi:dTDP-4-dehydrorhamnose reductase